MQAAFTALRSALSRVMKFSVTSYDTLAGSGVHVIVLTPLPDTITPWISAGTSPQTTTCPPSPHDDTAKPLTDVAARFSVEDAPTAPTTWNCTMATGPEPENGSNRSSVTRTAPGLDKSTVIAAPCVIAVVVAPVA